MVEFTKDAKAAYVLSSLGRETTALVRLDVSTGEVLEEIASSDKARSGASTVGPSGACLLPCSRTLPCRSLTQRCANRGP